MADTTVTIAASGADYTTIASALAASDVSSGAWIMQITDTRNYGALTADESLTFAATTGTPTQANRLILEADANSRHSGVLESEVDSNHAKLMSTSASNNPYQFQDSYTEIRYMQMGVTSGFDLIEIEFTELVTDLLFSRCLFIIKEAGAADHVIKYRANTGPNTFSLYLDNCVFVDVGMLFSYVGAADNTVNLYVDHCAVETATSSSEALADINFLNLNDQTANIYANNNWFECTGGTTGYVDTQDAGSNCTATISGAYNVGDLSTPFGDPGVTDNTTNYEYASGGLTQVTTTSDAIILTSFDPAAKENTDATPAVATGAGSNQLFGYAGNRIGSEPDSRQDFSTDIAGNSRPTKTGFIDVGPFQITTSPGFKYWDGTTWVDSVSVQYYNGTTWADVVAVKYWNGTTWADPV